MEKDKDSAEGATTPETLRQKDRWGMKLWKAALYQRVLTEGVSLISLPK